MKLPNPTSAHAIPNIANNASGMQPRLVGESGGQQSYLLGPRLLKTCHFQSFPATPHAPARQPIPSQHAFAIFRCILAVLPDRPSLIVEILPSSCTAHVSARPAVKPKKFQTEALPGLRCDAAPARVKRRHHGLQSESATRFPTAAEIPRPSCASRPSSGA
jgi:hypothetical protein